LAIFRPHPSHPSVDRRRVARSLGMFYLAGPAVAEIWLLTTTGAGAAVVPLLLSCLLAQTLGVLFMRGVLDRAPVWVLKALLTLATIIVGGMSLLSGSTASGFTYLFLWATPCAFFFGLRHAIVQVSFAAICLVGVHGLVEGGTLLEIADDGDCLLPLATLGVVGTMVHRLTSELLRADRERSRNERERVELEGRRSTAERERARREAAMGRLGRIALRATDRQELLDEVVAVLQDTLRVEECTIHELVGGGERVRLAAGAGAVSRVADVEHLPVDDRLLTGWVLAGEEPVVVWEWASERRLDVHRLRDHGIRSSAAAALRGRTGAFGIVSVHSQAVGAFSAEDAQWLQSVADLLASALDRERSEATARHQSLHDALTGLPNRALLYDRIEHAFARIERNENCLAVLLLDVDQFKTINDSLGHEAGDDLLIALSGRLQDVTRGGDTVARLGGDEFVVLCEVATEDEAFAIADRIADSWSQPVSVGSGELFISASVGIAVAYRPEAPDKMLREADAAMYRAKESGRGRSALFDEEMRQQAFKRLRMESDLVRAVERGQFRVHYQPIFDVEDQHLVGLEALVRWERPGRGLVGPDAFISVAEETGLIVPLGRWVLEEATAEVSAWRQRYPHAADLRVTVNVSGQQLARPEFLAEVRTALDRGGLAPESLGLEITESVLMKDKSAPLSTLADLRASGVRVLLDDFGTGYSSLARLKSFPLDAIKIDRSFVDGLGREEEDTAIVNAIVEIADSLDLEVVAEGVESAGQLEALREVGCPTAQGFLFARPLPPAQIEAMLAAGARAPVAAR
jgi:diguanylate cyclase (GGDEF)-like protein